METPKFKDYENLIRKEAWRWAGKLPWLNFDDLCGAGHEAFCQALKTWDPEKGAFSTHLFWTMQGYIKRVKGMEGHENEKLESAENIPDYHNPERETGFRTALASLSREAQEVIHLIFNVPGELVDMTLERVAPSKSSIRAYLSTCKWPGKKINKVFVEIKGMLQTL